MNAACPQRVSLISALGLPTILSPTIGAMTGDHPAARRFGSPPIARYAGFVFRSKTRPSTPTESSSRRLSSWIACVTDWSFSFRCSPPRIAATQLRFDTARLFTAQKRTSTAPSHCPLRRTSAGFQTGLERTGGLVNTCDLRTRQAGLETGAPPRTCEYAHIFPFREIWLATEDGQRYNPFLGAKGRIFSRRFAARVLN